PGTPRKFIMRWPRDPRPSWLAKKSYHSMIVPTELEKSSVRRLLTIAHMIGERVQLFLEVAAQPVGHFVLVQRSVHAPNPFVTLALADRERQMTHAQARMS